MDQTVLMCSFLRANPWDILQSRHWPRVPFRTNACPLAYAYEDDLIGRKQLLEAVFPLRIIAWGEQPSKLRNYQIPRQFVQLQTVASKHCESLHSCLEGCSGSECRSLHTVQQCKMFVSEQQKQLSSTKIDIISQDTSPANRLPLCKVLLSIHDCK